MKLFGDKSLCQVKAVLLVAEFAEAPLPISPKSQLKVLDSEHPGLDDATVVLQTPMGFLAGSAAVARYVTRVCQAAALYGEGPFQMSAVDQWLDWASVSLGSCSKQALGVLDAHLSHQTYIAAERLTMADLVIFASVAGRVSSADVKDAVHFKRWYSTIAGQDRTKKVLGDVTLVVEANTKEAQPKNPLEGLPPSPFVLDAWKRCYSNTKDLYGEAMRYFWENFDAEGWSLWHMKYDKLDDECKVSFVTSNQLGGFLQRADPNMRKYAFGNCNVTGQGSDFNISGVWLFRGGDMIHFMADHPSFEYHTFRKLDHTNDADKKLVADHWCAEDMVEGVPIVDSKIYK